MKLKKGTWPLILGISLLVVAILVIPLSIFLPLLRKNDAEKEFLIPGSLTFEAEEAGRYYLWNDYRTFYQGKTFRRSEQLPNGLEITVKDSNGEVLDFQRDTSISVTSNARAQKSIGYVELAKSGSLLVTVAGSTEERVFSFSRSRFWQFFAKIFGGIVAIVLISLSGLGLVIWGVIKLTKDDPEEKIPVNH